MLNVDIRYFLLLLIWGGWTVMTCYGKQQQQWHLGCWQMEGGDAIFCSPLDDPMYIRCTVKVEEMNIKYIIYW